MLPSAHLCVQHTFPRILEIDYRTSGTLCVVPLATSISVKINGISGSADHVMAVRGEVPCEIVERQTNLFGLLSLAPEISDRGWPVDRANVIPVENTAALRSFRLTVESLLAFASFNPEQARNANMLRRMEESLLSSLDEAMTSYPSIPSSAQFDRHLRSVRRMEEYLTLHPAADVDATELAQACDVSPRTLEAATRAVRGLSVHRYLRLRRLWSARCALALGQPQTNVSDVARANGFWHMGEFASADRGTFGETPSETLARCS